MKQSEVVSAAPKGFFTIPNAAAGATSLSSAVENSATSVLTAPSATTTASAQGFQPIALSSSASLATSALESSVSSALTSALASVLTSDLSQTLATSELLSNNATAALTPLGSAGGAATATATATAVNSPLQPLPGSSVAATASLQPLNGAEGSASTTTAAGLEPLSNAAADATSTSLKPLGGTEAATSLQPLSSITGSAQSAATTFFQSGRAGASGTVTATNGFNSAVASSVLTAKAATNVMLPWMLSVVLAGITACLLP
ncbi:hypothetical protein PFICI_01339 [Pestalotiopsis fici W106-1]|uniref:Uncharacterized protein n=1 Tax=Pestalotiopsis fici (strain W106-1 / CGMCC3.15140) TaxID=1229662 RepID=W3XQG6_PESFW|nr:uncharacterized protein PFICI_01339 [Pestalotiopsis fici W106-1]ETS87511.1 hypothetical protein PFICI_01339 [Pestalotiopsis fici W106-1]